MKKLNIWDLAEDVGILQSMSVAEEDPRKKKELRRIANDIQNYIKQDLIPNLVKKLHHE